VQVRVCSRPACVEMQAHAAIGGVRLAVVLPARRLAASALRTSTSAPAPHVPTAMRACAADTPRARHLGGTWAAAGCCQCRCQQLGSPSQRDGYASTRALRHARPQLRSHVGQHVLERSQAAQQALERGTWAHLGLPSSPTTRPSPVLAPFPPTTVIHGGDERAGGCAHAGDAPNERNTPT